MKLIVDPERESSVHDAAVSPASRYLVGVDPGSALSAFCVIERESRRPVRFGKIPNAELLGVIADLEPPPDGPNLLAVEMVVTNGMPARAEVFEACVQIGRLQERWDMLHGSFSVRLSVSEVRAHLCGGHRGAKDQNVRIALLDRFAQGVRNYGKGTKDFPGFFYGFAADVWQAFAVAVAFADELEARGWVPRQLPTCWCGSPVGERDPGDKDGLGCLGNVWHDWVTNGAVLAVPA